MANRALAAKAERADRQRIELGRIEGTKSFYMTAPKAEIVQYDEAKVRRFKPTAKELLPAKRVSRVRADDTARGAFLRGLERRSEPRRLTKGLLWV